MNQVEKKSLAFYVSPIGDDLNEGTLERPFATLEKARDAIRKRKADSGLPTGGVTVYLRGGLYPLADTFTLTPLDSGEAGSPVVYCAYPGETPIISGGMNVNGWRRAEGIHGMSPLADGHLWVADIPIGKRPHFLYVNGVGSQPAKKYKSDDWHNDWYKIYNQSDEIENCQPGGQTLRFRKNEVDLSNLPTNGDLEMDFYPVSFWNCMSVLKSIDVASNSAVRHSKVPSTFWRNAFDAAFGCGWTNFANAVPFIEREGEWCVDSAQGKLYHWPEDDSMDGKTAEIPCLYELIRFQGDDEAEGWKHQVHHVELRGLTLQYTDRMPEDQWPDAWLKRNAENPDGAVYLEGVRDCTIEDNTIVNVGTYGVVLSHYAQNIDIVHNEIGFSGSGGVQISGYGPGVVNVCKNNRIERNNIHDVGLVYKHSACVTIYGSGYNRIRLNYMKNLPYAAVAILGAYWKDVDSGIPEGFDTYGSGEAMFKLRSAEIPRVDYWTAKEYLHSEHNLVEKNIIDDGVLTLCDGGALYSWCSGNHNTYRQNCVFKSKSNGLLYEEVLYMDDDVDYAVLEGNICWAPGENITKGQQTNLWVNNEKSFPAKPKGFDALRGAIIDEANKAGGWLRASVWKDTPRFADIKIQAEDFRRSEGNSTLEGGGGSTVSGKNGGGWLCYDNIDFGPGAVQFSAYMAVDSSCAGRKLELRLDSVTGPRIGVLSVGSTGGPDVYAIQSCNLKGAVGLHDLYLVPKGSEIFRGNLDWFVCSRPADSQIHAEFCSGLSGATVNCGGEIGYVGDIEGGGWLHYSSIDFGAGVSSFSARVAVDPAFAGKQMELRLDSVSGPAIGIFTISNTGGWSDYQVQSCRISGAIGLHDLYIVPIGEGCGFGNIDWFSFR